MESHEKSHKMNHELEALNEKKISQLKEQFNIGTVVKIKQDNIEEITYSVIEFLQDTYKEVLDNSFNEIKEAILNNTFKVINHKFDATVIDLDNDYPSIEVESLGFSFITEPVIQIYISPEDIKRAK
jgi:hypothetical protein